MLNPIEEIKNRLDIVEVIGSYIKLQKAGANFRALCPFHSEKKPSFFVSPRLQIFKCFGCGAGGDIFKFIMMIENVEFGDALRILAQKAGIEIEKVPLKLKTERQKILDILEISCLFFEKQLEGEKGKEVKEYLKKRGIGESSIQKWRIGYAPNSKKALLNFLLDRGFKTEEIKKTGLLFKKNGEYFDRFRGRIMFPIFDFNSQVIGFSGRIFGEREKEKGVAKYVNTPNTLVFDKGKVLYGLNFAKKAIREKDFCVLVEGQTDCILVSQAGTENVVATSGTALTPYHLRVLKRHTSNLVIAFDMDVAGEGATKRGIDLAQMLDFNIKIILLPKEKDPADVVSEGKEKWEKYLNSAKDILTFYFETAFSNFDKNTPEGKKEIAKILLPVLKRIPNKIVQASWIQRLAKELKVKEEDIREELKKVKIEREMTDLITFEEKLPEMKKKSKKELLEERVISLLIRKPDLIDLIKEDFLDFFSEKSLKILNSLKEGILKKEEKEISKILEKIEEKLGFEDKEFLRYLILKSEVEKEEIKEPEKEMNFCLKEIKREEIKKKLDELSFQIKEAEEKKDFEKLKILTEKFNNLSKKLL